MVDKPLTAKQEAFAQAVASGMTFSEAYRAAYDCSNRSDKTVNEHASRAMSDSKILARVKELKAQLADEVLWTRKEAAEVLRKAIALGLDSESHGKLADAVKSVEVLNKMTGLDAPLKLEHSGGVGVQVVAVADMSAVWGDEASSPD